MTYATRYEPRLEPLEIRHCDALLLWVDRGLFVYRDPPACSRGEPVSRRGDQ
jgi:hypothetical protein